MKLSDIDKKLLNLLQNNARLTHAQLAEKVGLSQSACHRRIKQMEDAGLIANYRAHLNRQAMGLKLMVFVFVKLDAHTEDILAPFRAGIKRMDEVVAFYTISGSGDYLLKVVTSDMEAYADIVLKQLVQLKGVRDIASNFVLSTDKPETGVKL